MPFSNKDIVRVSRRFAERQIRVYVTDTEVGGEVEMDAFIKALVEEVEADTFFKSLISLVSRGVSVKARLESKLQLAAKSAVMRLQHDIREEM